MLKHQVLIANDRAVSIDRIEAMLPPHFEVVATVRDTQALRRAAVRLKPDIILIDAAMAVQDEFRVVGEIARLLPHTRIVLHPDDAGCGSAAEDSSGVAAAARGMIKAMPDCDPPDAIKLTPKPDKLDTPAAGARLFRAMPPPGTSSSQGPTDREYQVLALLAAGYPMKLIARRLGITYRTVTFHKYRMMERLGITTNAGLMTYALKGNLAPPTEGKEFSLA